MRSEIFERAQAGDAEAQCILGNAFHLGLEVEQNLAEAMKWYRQAAEQGYGIAANNLAGILMTGYGDVAPNQAEANYWFAKAKEQGFDATPAAAYL